MIGIIIGSIVALAFVYVLVQYNSFVSLNNMYKEAFSTMDIYLKKRWDLIPNLVEVAKGYAKHESETLEEVVNLRNASYGSLNNDDKLVANEKITENIKSIMVIAENYPDLKASESFLELNKSLVTIEDEIANSRKYYNGVVKAFNNKVQMVPSSIIASMFKFTEKRMYEANANERENVTVNFDK